MSNTKERSLGRIPFQKAYEVSVRTTKARNLDDDGIHHIGELCLSEHYTDSEGNDQRIINSVGASVRKDPMDKEYYAAKAKAAAAD